MTTPSLQIRPPALLGRLAAILVCSAAAADVPETVTMRWHAAGDPAGPINVNLADVGDWAEMDDGGVVYTGALFSDTWQLSWTTTVHDGPAPSLESLLTVTNHSDDDRWFTTGTTWESPQSEVGQRMVDLASSVTLMNLDFAGDATLQSAPDEALIGGYLSDQQIASIFAPIYTLHATGPFAVAIDTASSSASGSMEPGGSMGYWSGFLLSGGDTVTFSTTMSAAAIPAPGALGLLLIAAARGRGRRRGTRRCLS
ncbi:MAG: hypothetical protein QF733_08290 [Phycisphaerales bacterium]|jgi:hypothetical protein|nr:hypothetical protein [Phycisphaerales bacterium]